MPLPDHPATAPPGVRCVACEHDASVDPVQLLEPADDPATVLGWLCIDCFDLYRVLGAID